MILAAGRGERMGALTQTRPKPLLEVAGQPLLAWQLERLAAAGIRDLVVNVAYLADQIIDFLAQSRWQHLHIQISREMTALETGGGIRQALPLLGDDPFLVVNSDIWLDYPLAQLVPTAGPALPAGCLGRLILVPNPPHHPVGDFALTAAPEDAQYTFSGLSVLAPQLFRHLTPGRFALGPLLRAAIERGEIVTELYTGTWVDVGTPERLQQVSTGVAQHA